MAIVEQIAVLAPSSSACCCGGRPCCRQRQVGAVV